MTSPFTWDVAKPAGADAINAGDDQLRTDKTTVRDVLRTLVPYGTPTTGWRDIQINNDHYLVQNAKFDGTNFSHDDTTLDATGFLMLSTGEVRAIFRKAAASTWLPAAWLVSGEFSSIAVAVNWLQLKAAATATQPELRAVGSDANIDVVLTPKGTGLVKGVGGYALGPVFSGAQTSTQDVTNTATETDLYSVSIPQNTLLAGRRLTLLLGGDVLQNATGFTLQIKVKLGTTTLYDSGLVGWNSSASRQAFGVIADIFAIAANSQLFMGGQKPGPWGTATNLFGATVTNLEPEYFGVSTSTEDNGAGAKTLSVTAKWSGASVAASCRALGVKVQVWP